MNNPLIHMPEDQPICQCNYSPDLVSGWEISEDETRSCMVGDNIKLCLLGERPWAKIRGIVSVMDSIAYVCDWDSEDWQGLVVAGPQHVVEIMRRGAS